MILDTSIKYLHAIELPTPFPVGPITVYLANAPGEPLTLVDTGPLTEDARAALEAGLGKLGQAVADLELILVTHAHVDHFGLLARLVEASGAKVLTHPWNVPALSDYAADRDQRVVFYASVLHQAGVPGEVMQTVGRMTQGMRLFGQPAAVDATLDEDDTLRMAGCDWRVLHTPGHAAGLICLYELASRTLLSSDHLLADISSNPVVEPPPPGHTERPRSLVLYTESLRRVAGMDIKQALPSHGPVIHDVPGLVEQRLAFHQGRLARIVGVLQNGARTTWDVTQALFPDRTPLDTFLAVSEVVGHLDVLEIEGVVTGKRDGGMDVWTLV
jgi:glyoxylase-like metal-dependent hydrolase (beta-lactamase superfamily II)